MKHPEEVEYKERKEKPWIDKDKEKIVCNVRGKTIAVISDLHIPHENKSFVKLEIESLNDLKPEIIILNGDILDCLALSAFDHDMKDDESSLEYEIGKAKEFLRDLRKACPDSKIVFLEGNHEMRLRKYLMRRAPELNGLVTLPDLLSFDKFGIEWMPARREAVIAVENDTLVGHFDIARKNAGYTARELVERHNKNIVQGHVHRAAYVTKNTGTEELVGVEGGCGCELRPDYASYPNWANAFVLIDVDKEGKKMFKLIHFKDGQFEVNGKKYKI
jgi:UDP-2,3-diacylglucosamine pyrophosphatase LpxH